jgi:oligosaccharide:H+ symporter
MRAPLVLSLYWFLALGALGAFFPFFTLYLRENAGLSAAEVGAVMAMLPLVGIFAQPAWGVLADHTGSRTRVLTVVTFGAAAGYAALYFADGVAQLVAATACFSLFSSPLVSTSVAVSFALLAERGLHAFGLVRVWGTIGYLVTVAVLPTLLAHLRAAAPHATPGVSQPALGFIFPVAAALTAAAGVVSLALAPDTHAAVRARRQDWHALVRHGAFVRVLVFMFAAYVFLHGPMVFFPLYVRSLGGSVDMIGTMWVLMVALEVPLVALSGAGFRRLGARTLLAIGVGSGALRWLACGWSDAPWVVYPVQVLHGVTVAGLIIGAPLYVEAVVPERLRSTAQGMLAMVGVSLGGIASSLLAGWLIETHGSAALARVAGFGALALTLAVPVMIPAARQSGTAAEWSPEKLGAEPF